MAVAGTSRKGFIDINVTCGKPGPVFVIEAKRDGTKINAKHRQQALEYGESVGVLLVAVTNGRAFELLNSTTKKPRNRSPDHKAQLWACRVPMMASWRR